MAGGVGRHVYHLGAGVLVLVFAGEGDGEGFTARVGAEQEYCRVLHVALGADVAVYPFHGGAFFTGGALGD